MHSLLIDIYGVILNIESNEERLVELLRKDFSFFEINASEKTGIKIKVFREEIPWNNLNGKVIQSYSKNCLISETGKTKYVDYHGKLLTEYDYSSDSGVIYSTDLSLLHEITYLLILSRSSKKLDSKGIHKIHGFAVSNNRKALIGMAESGVGKTTLFLDIIKDSSLDILSDDTPIINKNGSVLPFPLRIGIEDEAERPPGNQDLSYTLERREYGKKLLFPIDFFKNDIGTDCNEVVLISLKRHYSNDCIVKKISKLKMLKPLFKNMVVGVGLPMVIEYFLEFTVKDFFRLTLISIRRFVSALNLLRKSKTYEIYLGRDRELNSKRVLELIL